MFLAEVTGTVVATRKHDSLTGCKLLLVRDMSETAKNKPALVAVDVVGAGKGEIVLVATGSAARLSMQNKEASADLAIVGIVDQVEGAIK